MKLSGVGGGELGELADLLMSMREEREDMSLRKNAARNEETRRQERKEEAGRRIILAASSLSHPVSKVNDDSDEEEEGIDKAASNNSARKKRRVVQHESEMDLFGQHLKEAELARVVMEKDRLYLDRERFAAVKIEREKNRNERREERVEDRLEPQREREEQRHGRREDREPANNLDLEKFDILINTVVGRSKRGRITGAAICLW